MTTSVLYHLHDRMQCYSAVAPVSQTGTSIYKFSIKVVKVKANVDKNQIGYKGTSGNCQISSFNKGNSETDKLEENKS